VFEKTHNVALEVEYDAYEEYAQKYPKAFRGYLEEIKKTTKDDWEYGFDFRARLAAIVEGLSTDTPDVFFQPKPIISPPQEIPKKSVAKTVGSIFKKLKFW
jgi:hypothetical protein